MKIKLSVLRKLIKEQIISEVEMRSVPKISRDKLIKIFKDYNVDEDVTWSDGINFDEMVDYLEDNLNQIGRIYSSSEKMMPDERSLKMIRAALTEPLNYGEDNEKVPSFMLKAISKGFINDLADRMRITIRGRGAPEADDGIIMSVMKSLLDATYGVSDKPGLNNLADLFKMYGYSKGTKMSNELLGNITKFRKEINADKSSGALDLDDRFARSGGVSKQAVSDMLRTRID